MSDLQFDVKPRSVQPITFRLGGENALLEVAVPAIPSSGSTTTYPERRGRDDYEYVFTPPKNAVMLMPVLEVNDSDLELGLTKSTFNWLGGGLSEEARSRVIARLKDPKDDLDIDTLSEVVTKLQEIVTARPTM